MSPQQQINAIDKQITAVHRELQRREKIKPMCAASWQAAWNKHPDLRAQESGLFRQRGLAQRERDIAAHKALMARPVRFNRPKKCPTCGCHTLAA